MLKKDNRLVLFGGYGILLVGLFFYSFTQVDLNLTLTRISFWFAVQDYFQHIGYYQRMLSTGLYIALLSGMFIMYGVFLRRAYLGSLGVSGVWRLLGLTAGILLFSYPAFSYDLFNYLFDARIFTFHGENPYLHKALDYPDDPWTHFMRWTHRTYPYGPLWLFLTVPLSYLGFQKFVVTLYLFKFLMGASYVMSVVFLYKILRVLRDLRGMKENEMIASTALFALNPLVIIESLVSAHNDIVMVAFTLASFYFLFVKKYWASALLLVASIAIKFATVFLIPLYVWWYIHNRSNKADTPAYVKRFLYFSLVLMCGAIVAATVRTQFQPWYLLYVIPFAVLAGVRYSIVIPIIILSLAGLLQYVPYLFRGNWDAPVPAILNGIMIGGMVMTVAVTLMYKTYRTYMTNK